MPERNNEYVYPPATEELRQRINNAGFSDEFKQQIKSAQKEEGRKMFERLTNRNESGIAYAKIPTNPSNMIDVGECYTGRIIDHLAAYEDSGLSPEEVQELAKAKADGRLLVLSCKVGETIWKIKAVFSYFSKPMEDRVERIIISSNEILVCCTSGTKFSVNSIGKTVFLTRAAAEKALEVRE